MHRRVVAAASEHVAPSARSQRYETVYSAFLTKDQVWNRNVRLEASLL